MDTSDLHLFQAFGVELECMIADRRTLAVRPIADELLRSAHQAGGRGDAEDWPGEVVMGDATWSNELALHVVELKTSAPAPSLGGLAGRFQRHVQRANTLLRTRNALLLPSGMHPFMDPTVSVPVAPALTRSTTRSTAFDCRGHGWPTFNLRTSTSPFAGDEDPTTSSTPPRRPPRASCRSCLALSAARRCQRQRGPTRALEMYRTNAARVPGRRCVI